MAYTKTNWQNGATPAINADNLNHMEQGIYDATENIEANGLGSAVVIPYTVTTGSGNTKIYRYDYMFPSDGYLLVRMEDGYSKPILEYGLKLNGILPLLPIFRHKQQITVVKQDGSFDHTSTGDLYATAILPVKKGMTLSGLIAVSTTSATMIDELAPWFYPIQSA